MSKTFSLQIDKSLVRVEDSGNYTIKMTATDDADGQNSYNFMLEINKITSEEEET
jgi:hypothetical protein